MSFKGLTLCSWEQRSYPGATWASIVDDHIKRRPRPSPYHTALVAQLPGSRFNQKVEYWLIEQNETKTSLYYQTKPQRFTHRPYQNVPPAQNIIMYGTRSATRQHNSRPCAWGTCDPDICMMTSSTGNISALLALCVGNSSVNYTHKGQWRKALVFSLICALNKRLSKQSWGWWFETPPRSLWRHCNGGCLPHTRWLMSRNVVIKQK